MPDDESYTVSRITLSARKYYKRCHAEERTRIRNAIAKICENPFRNHRRFSIRFLKGKWNGYLEYRSNTRPIFRVIYRISDEDAQQIEVCEKLRHL